MNDLTALLVEEAVTRVRASLLDGQPAAVIGIEADQPIWLTDLSYWRQPYAFEAEAGDMAVEQRSDRAVLAVPLITLAFPDGRFVFRPAEGEVDDEETQQVWVVSLDLADGMDVHRCVYRTAPDGLLFFEDLQTFNGDTSLDEGAPGWQLVQTLIRAV